MKDPNSKGHTILMIFTQSFKLILQLLNWALGDHQ